MILTTSVRRSGQTQRRDDGRTSSLQSPASVEPTTGLERLLLFAVIALVPLQDHVPNIAGFSVMYIMFALLAGYVLLWRTNSLGKVLCHPAILAGWALVGTAGFMELANDSAGYYEILRIGLMVLGAVLVAALCRDRQAMRVGYYGYLLASLGLTAFLLLTTYGKLDSASAQSFQGASKVRQEAFAESALGIDLNVMGFFAGQGAIVAVAMAVAESARWRRLVLLTVGIFCLVGSFLPMSRGAVVIVLVSCIAVLYARGITQPKVLLLLGILALSTALWVPDVALKRMEFTTEKHLGRMEGRAARYTAAVRHLPEYVLTGVGKGNFSKGWGKQRGFGGGSHNCFVEVTIFWGLPGLLVLLAVVWQGYRCIPRLDAKDPLWLCLLGISISVLLESMVVQTVYAKQFSLALGMLVGSSLWIWPSNVRK